MTSMLFSQNGFIAILLLFGAGAAGSLAFLKNDNAAHGISSIFSIAGSFWGIVFSLATVLSKQSLAVSFNTGALPLFSLSFHVDILSAFFVFVISLIGLFCSVYGVGYVKHYFGKYNIGSLGFFYNTFILGMLCVVTSDNGLFFLIAWEIMSVASYFLVIYEHNTPENIRAGFLYLVMTHIATAFLIIAFLVLYTSTGSFDFGPMRQSGATIPQTLKNVLFILFGIGLGTKAGIIPFHIWLPSAHPAAPSHVSALMSGVMIKTGIYMMIRMFFDILQPVPVWWGLTVLIAGSVSSLLGVLYALTEHDIKKLLACHSIENIGIILLGLGASLTFLSFDMPSLALLGLIASLFHTLNHATFKSLLFLSAGSVINATHTKNMEKYGGLIKLMPQTAVFFLIGSMAISALPPFNGFFSEWLTFQSLFLGIAQLNVSVNWVFIMAAGSLAFTGGLALTCFVKAFGVTFLARSRSADAAGAHESSLSLRTGMAALAALSLLSGLFSGTVTTFLDGICRDLAVFRNAPAALAVSFPQKLSVVNFSFVSAPLFFALFAAMIFAVFVATKYLVGKNQNVRVGATWNCGTDLSPRMEITATGFSRSIITIFKGILKPSIQHETEYHDDETRYLPKSRKITLSVLDIYLTYLYKPINKVAAILSVRAKAIQSGNVNLYILYIFIALLAALTLVK